MNLHTLFILIILVLMVIVVLLANIELWYNKRKCKCKTNMPKISTVIMPNTSGMSKPIYVYNKDKIKKRDLDFQLGFNDNDYIKKKIGEHVASKIAVPLRDIFGGILNVPKSKTPINTLYNSLGKSDEALLTANPLTFTDANKYRMLISKADAMNEAFIAGGVLYFI